MNTNVTAEIQVVEASATPEAYGKKNWSVRCKLLRVISGTVPAGLSEITLLVHSPTKTFATKIEDLPQYTFAMEFEDPIINPYQGRFRILSWHKLSGG